MPRDIDIWVVPSVLDRLIDDRPGETSEALPTRAESLRRFRANVLRDLETLLNTRNPLQTLAAEFVEVAQSGLAFGVPDTNLYTLTSTADQARLRGAIEQSIRTFEPRLIDVTVQVRPPAATGADRALHLHVDAQLNIDPSPEPMTFDIVLPLATRGYTVREAD